MASLLEYVGCVHIFLGPYRGNPIALYMRRTDSGCQIGPKVYPWNDVMGVGETPNKAAADFEEKWKVRGLTAGMYSGPAWEGGIKPEKPAPPKPTVAPKPVAAASAGQPTPSTQAPADQATTAPVPDNQAPSTAQPSSQSEQAIVAPSTNDQQTTAPTS
ncbi:MAG: hypothetical protein OEY28_04100 [Nitrospira sp.]|nr:hypothetical protein [Nitrospira sp.]